jgi:arylsulfatase A-like enzyme
MSGKIERREFLKQGALGAAAVLSAEGLKAREGEAPQPANAKRRLNVLHVISDQYQAALTAYEGNTPHAITPNIDRLASEGMYFRKAYTVMPICTPSRVSILSGQYCHNHGYYGLNGPPPDCRNRTDIDLPSYLSHFHDHGYLTAAFGKVHTPDDPHNWLENHCDKLLQCYYGPTGRKGGNYSIEYAGYLQSLGLLEKEDSVQLPECAGLQQLDGRPSNLPYKDSVEGWSVQKAIEFLDGIGDAPFCMQVSLPRPHECFTPDKRFWEMYPDNLPLPPTLHNDDSGRPPHFRAAVEHMKKMNWCFEPKTFEAGARRIWHGYLGCITQVDYALGQLVEYLKRSGKYDNTIILFGADHGSYSGTYGIAEKAPGICSDAVCRVPLVWRVPGATPGGKTCLELVENVDIAPTLASLCGLPPMNTADGKDLSGLLRGGSKALREVAVTENPWSKHLRWGPWEFVHYPLEMFGKDVGELYNVEKDPNETHNLYYDRAYQATVQECRRHLLEWLIRTTRYVTAWPPPKGTKPTYWAVLGADGKASNPTGIEELLRRGMLNYI